MPQNSSPHTAALQAVIDEMADALETGAVTQEAVVGWRHDVNDVCEPWMEGGEVPLARADAKDLPRLHREAHGLLDALSQRAAQV